ncbi:MAG TPA: Plug domain-containing protein, partial [Gemmatimonadales bacterium]|nr:Plug domain-containing protein [Gemmatimonadales bacterium]
SLAFSNIQTLSDLLAHIPGVYVSRGGIYGAAEPVLYAGRGAAGLEVYWDGVRYLPLGRDTVYLDPARISLAPLERVDVVVLPASLRVYLVTRRQRSTATASEVGIATGEVGTANYRGAYLRRWRSGLGLSLVADYNNNNGIGGTSSAPFNAVDLWLKAEYLRSARWGAAYELQSSSWHRSAATYPSDWHVVRHDMLLRLFAAERTDGLGLRAQASVATSGTTQDTAVADRHVTENALELSDDWPRAHLGLAFRTLDQPRPWEVEGTAGWNPFPGLTLAGDARHAHYSRGRHGNRAHLAAGLLLPAGFSVRGEVAWARDLQAPVDTADAAVRTLDYAAALRWDRRRVSVEFGEARRDAFAPIGFPVGIPSVSGLRPMDHARYATAQGAVELLPGLTLAGWYFNPLVPGGTDFEPPYHGRLSLTFFSRFWRVYRSGIFALRGEFALESWSHGVAGLGAAGVPLVLPAKSFGESNIEVRIGGVTIFWIQRNTSLTTGSYVPGLDYPRHYQFYGVRWRFTN